MPATWKTRCTQLRRATFTVRLLREGERAMRTLAIAVAWVSLLAVSAAAKPGDLTASHKLDRDP